MEDFHVIDKAANLCFWHHKMWRNVTSSLIFYNIARKHKTKILHS